MKERNSCSFFPGVGIHVEWVSVENLKAHLSIFQKYLEVVIALRDKCFSLGAGGGGKKKVGKLCVKSKTIPCETQEVTTAPNSVPPTTTLAVLFKQFSIFFHKGFHTHSMKVLRET